jgi:hypothetical protein
MMNPDVILEGMVSQGPFAVVCAVMFWRDFKRDEREDRREERREGMERDRIKADADMAVALSLIADRVHR